MSQLSCHDCLRVFEVCEHLGEALEKLNEELAVQEIAKTLVSGEMGEFLQKTLVQNRALEKELADERAETARYLREITKLRGQYEAACYDRGLLQTRVAELEEDNATWLEIAGTRLARIAELEAENAQLRKDRELLGKDVREKSRAILELEMKLDRAAMGLT